LCHLVVPPHCRATPWRIKQLSHVSLEYNDFHLPNLRPRYLTDIYLIGYNRLYLLASHEPNSPSFKMQFRQSDFASDPIFLNNLVSL
jgi:hypothetical protein